MNPSSTRLRTAATAGAVLAAVTLAACASNSSTNAGSGSSSSASASGGASEGVKYSRSQVAANLNPVRDVKIPEGSISGLEKFRGGTVTYVPITLQATYFQAQAEQISEALKPLGIKVQACDAKAQPTVATQCINQAIAGKSVGIVTDSLPFALAQNAYDAAAAAGIPIVASDVTDEVPEAQKGKITTTVNGQDVGARLMANAIIADSGGGAHVLFVSQTTTSTTKKVAEAVREEFATRCPDCVVSEAPWEPTAVQKIPTAVSVGLSKDPQIRYVFVQYDQPAGPLAIQGMKLSSQATGLKLVGYGSDVSAMQRIANGEQLADVATDPAVIAYNNTDRLLRMMTGMKVPDAAASYTVPRRVFNGTNINTVQGTNVEQFKNGAWFTDGSFRTDYQKLWATK